MNLLDKLKSAVKNDRTLIAYACDEEREHPFLFNVRSAKGKIATLFSIG